MHSLFLTTKHFLYVYAYSISKIMKAALEIDTHFSHANTRDPNLFLFSLFLPNLFSDTESTGECECDEYHIEFRHIELENFSRI